MEAPLDHAWTGERARLDVNRPARRDQARSRSFERSGAARLPERAAGAQGRVRADQQVPGVLEVAPAGRGVELAAVGHDE